jgi:hypothetical protein
MKAQPINKNDKMIHLLNDAIKFNGIYTLSKTKNKKVKLMLKFFHDDLTALGFDIENMAFIHYVDNDICLISVRLTDDRSLSYLNIGILEDVFDIIYYKDGKKYFSYGVEQNYDALMSEIKKINELKTCADYKV